MRFGYRTPSFKNRFFPHRTPQVSDYLMTLGWGLLGLGGLWLVVTHLSTLIAFVLFVIGIMALALLAQF